MTDMDLFPTTLLENAARKALSTPPEYATIMLPIFVTISERWFRFCNNDFSSI
jgi:hypothetical protein